MSISTCGFWGFSGGHLGRRDWLSWPLQVHRKRCWAQSCFKGPPENPQKWYAEINQILLVVSGGFLGVTWAAASGFLSCLRPTRNVSVGIKLFLFASCRVGIRALCRHHTWYSTHILTKTYLTATTPYAHTCQTYFMPGLH